MAYEEHAKKARPPGMAGMMPLTDEAMLEWWQKRAEQERPVQEPPVQEPPVEEVQESPKDVEQELPSEGEGQRKRGDLGT